MKAVERSTDSYARYRTPALQQVCGSSQRWMIHAYLVVSESPAGDLSKRAQPSPQRLAHVYFNLRPSPDADSNARLFAYELLALDLRGLELLTLSACETALGQFDTADHLRGLPASFLLAGVSTIIGTLWPVAVEPAERFFTSLYEQLKAGVTRLEAFTTAQQTTRAEFPKYRHWGAFYLIGEWS